MVITLSLRRDVAAILIHAKLITKGGRRAFLSSTSSHISQNPNACKNLNLGDEPSQGFRTPRWLIDTSTTRGPNIYMRSPFRVLGNPWKGLAEKYTFRSTQVMPATITQAVTLPKEIV